MRFLTLLVLFLFTDAADVSLIVALGQHRLAWLIIIAFVQAQVLRRLLGRRRAFYDDSIQCCRQQQMVIYVCPCDADRKRAASFLNKQALLDAHLGTVGGVRADPFALGGAVLRCLALLALPPFLPMKRALFMQPSAACHSQ